MYRGGRILGVLGQDVESCPICSSDMNILPACYKYLYDTYSICLY